MKISKALATLSLVGSSLFVESSVHAESALEYIQNITTTGEGDLLTFLRSLLNTGIALAALVCVAILIYAGYSYITASGDETKIQKATSTLTWAIVGLIICFVAVILVQFVLTKLIKAQ
ncbi:MAG: Mbov_0395 family pilin-like conjugal transfer protein [Candidatus Dojkabacteria bacterium]|jgi:cytochrome bd-type quinol oxidase subunit 2